MRRPERTSPSRVRALTPAELEQATGGADEALIEVSGWSHGVDAPRDAASGLPTGKRRHVPLAPQPPEEWNDPADC